MKISELNLILRKLTIKKLFNAGKLYVSYFVFSSFKSGKRRAYPVSISVEPTSLCNLKCPECPTGKGELTRYKGHIEFNLYRKIIDEFSPFIINLILYFQGEPFLNPHIFQLIEYASGEKKIFTTTSSNGHYFSAETFKRL